MRTWKTICLAALAAALLAAAAAVFGLLGRPPSADRERAPETEGRRAYCVLVVGGRMDARDDFDRSFASELEEILGGDFPVRVINRTFAEADGDLIGQARKYADRYRPNCIIALLGAGRESARRIPDEYLFAPDSAVAAAALWDSGRDRGFYQPLAEMFSDCGDFFQAYAMFAGALSRAPQEADLIVGLARCLRKCGRAAQARAFVGRALELSPEHTGALVESGLLAIDEGAPAAARARLLRARESDPESMEACYAWAEFLRSSGALDELSELVASMRGAPRKWAADFVARGGAAEGCAMDEIGPDSWIEAQYLRGGAEVAADAEALAGLCRARGMLFAVLAYPLGCPDALGAAVADRGIFIDSGRVLFHARQGDEDVFFDDNRFVLARGGIRVLAAAAAGRVRGDIEDYFSASSGRAATGSS